MIRALYSFGIHVYTLLVEILSLVNRKARMTRFGQWKTNGILREQIDPDAQYIWFHAASLGEFEQGRPMIEAIKKKYPDYKILLTFFSPSGYEVRKNYPGADVICYLPFDSPYRVNKFLNLSKPSMAIFIKYEFWMNYLHELKRREIPTFLISSIFRKEQLFFKWYGKWYKNVLWCFNHMYVQDEDSKKLLSQYGIEHATVCGDTRFDRVLDVCSQARMFPILEKYEHHSANQSPVVFIAGSTWPPDEEIILRYFNEHKRMKMIIAPHEIDRNRLMDIESYLRRPSIRFSEINEQNIMNRDCIIVDSFGSLSSIYRYGSIAYVGGGFGKGIHNVLEAAVYGIPVIIGPKYHKFKEARDLIAAGGAFSVTDDKAFVSLMDDLLAHPEKIKKAGEAAATFVQRNSGATRCIMEKLPL